MFALDQILKQECVWLQRRLSQAGVMGITLMAVQVVRAGIEMRYAIPRMAAVRNLSAPRRTIECTLAVRSRSVILRCLWLCCLLQNAASHADVHFDFVARVEEEGAGILQSPCNVGNNDMSPRAKSVAFYFHRQG